MSGVIPKTRAFELRVLGPLEVCIVGAPVPLGARKQQTALALLAVHAGRVVTLDELVDELWPDGPPASAVANVRSYLANLRRLFESAEGRHGRLTRRGAGYQLTAEPDELDLLAYSARCTEGHRARGHGELTEAAARLTEALVYWRGPILAGLPRGPRLAARCAVIEEERMVLIEELAEIQLMLDEPARAIGLLHPHVQMHPLRERGHALLMRSLYRIGDVAGALSAYADARRALVEELGIEPGRELRDLHRSMLDRDFDPVGSRPTLPIPAELPADLIDFVGRAAETERAVALLTETAKAAVPVCGIVGQPGVGKTSLAVHVGHRLRETYPDGQLFVDLRGADSHPLVPAEVLARFLRALGLPGNAIPHDAQERAALYRSLLAERRMLVLLDNAADEAQVSPLLPGTASCGVLVTSRYRLAGLFGADLIDLGVLATDSALVLLHWAAGEVRVRAEPTAAADLVRLCGGLPLALRVVGVKLAMSPHRTLAALVDRLAEERHRLDQLSHAGLAVRSSLDFSYERLSPGHQVLMRRVALLDAPDFAAWTAAAVADCSLRTVEEGLDRLVAGHLVQTVGPDVTGQPRFRLHDLIRVYARERAAVEEPADERRAAILRALRHWLVLVTVGETALFGRGSYLARIGRELNEATPDPKTVRLVEAGPLEWIEAEHSALVVTVRQASDVDLPAECWRLACVSMRMIDHRAYVDDVAAVHTIALDAARRVGDRRGEAVALVALAKVQIQFGHYVQARRQLQSAEDIFVGLRDAPGLSHCYRQLALR